VSVGRAAEPIPVQTLTISPQPVPDRALRYPLLPPVIEETPGDALNFYNIAIMLLARGGSDEQDDSDRVSAWLDAPLDDLPRAEVKAVLDRHRAALEYTARGARRESCRWDYPIHEGKIMNVLLPSLAEYRRLAKLVALDARLAIAEGDYDRAIERVQTCLGFARHLANAPLLIQDLVALAVAQLGVEQLELLLTQPDAPNLYWSYAFLPPRLIDLYDSLRVERNLVLLHWPELQDYLLDRTPKSDFARITPSVSWYEVLQPFADEADPREQVGNIALTALYYPRAYAFLREQGWSDDEIERTPTRTIVMIYMVNDFVAEADRYFRGLSLDYWQAVAAAPAEREQPRSAVGLAENLFAPLRSSLLNAARVRDRLTRQLRLQQIIEALRLHAYEHGTLPASLDDLAVPIQRDPLTGRAFEYASDGTGAVLTAPFPPGSTRPGDAIRYRIELRPTD
jgi:hypothetical protein